MAVKFKTAAAHEFFYFRVVADMYAVDVLAIEWAASTPYTRAGHTVYAILILTEVAGQTALPISFVHSSSTHFGGVAALHRPSKANLQQCLRSKAHIILYSQSKFWQSNSRCWVLQTQLLQSPSQRPYWFVKQGNFISATSRITLSRKPHRRYCA